MQQQTTTRGLNTHLAPDPGRKFVLGYLVILGSALALFIGTFFLPETLRDELLWKQPLPLLPHLHYPVSFFFGMLVLSIFIWPFINLPVMVWWWPFPTGWKWKTLPKKRWQALENHLIGRRMVTFPLPEVWNPLPATLSVDICRNWRVTWIAGAIYATLIGFVLLIYVSYWQSNMQYLAQQGEISAWTLLGVFLNVLFPCCLFILPAILAFIFAPRQRLIATQDGLICYRGLSFSYIPWHEARLFSVIAQHKKTLVCELTSKTSLIRWSSKPESQFADIFPAGTIGIAPLGLVEYGHSREAYQWQIKQLTHMVAAGTGLPLYDLRYKEPKIIIVPKD